MLLRPGHLGTLPTRILVNLVKGLLVECVFQCINFWKTKDELRSPSLVSRVTASSLGRFDCKVGRARKPKNPVDSTWNSKNLRFAVTREAWLGDPKLIFRRCCTYGRSRILHNSIAKQHYMYWASFLELIQ